MSRTNEVKARVEPEVLLDAAGEPLLHEACRLFPRMNDAELQYLGTDIKEHKQRAAITVINGYILDGRNRWLACRIAGVQPWCEEWDGVGSPVAFAISMNLPRRHLDSNQRAAIGYQMLPLLEKEAKERQGLSQGAGIKGAKASPSSTGRAVDIAAEIVGSNPRYIQEVKRIDGKAPELLERIQSGQLGIADAKALAELPTEQREEILQRINDEPRKSLEVRQIVKEVKIETHRREADKYMHGGSANLVLAMDEERVSVAAASLLAADADQQDEILELDKKAILQAAREIQEKRFAAKREERQRLRKTADNLQIISEDDQARVLCGDCFNLIPSLKDGSISLVLTSPPYAEQRKTQYSGVPEADFPQWAVKWMGLLKNKLAADGSVLIVIRPHLKQGVLSDYVLRTRLALREDGWLENEELIWLKPNGPPWGSTNRPRRAWESILWFSKSQNPFCDLQACGHKSDRIGFNGPGTAWSGNSPIHSGTNPVLSRGTTRCCDVFEAPVGVDKVEHPAVFPVALAEQLILTFSRPNDCVLDMFAGSGTSLVAAKMHQREYRGFDVEQPFVTLALQRLAEVAPSVSATHGVEALPWPPNQDMAKDKVATESAPQLAL